MSTSQSIDVLVREMQQKGILPKWPQETTGELFVKPELLEQTRRECDRLQSVELTEVDLQWLQVLSEGWAKPLKGFMREAQFLQCQHFNCLLEGEVSNQSVPIVLPVSAEDKLRMEGCEAITLRYQGLARAILRNPEFYQHRKEERCARQFGTTNPNHPYIKMIMASGDWLVGGEVEVLEKIIW